MAVITQGIESRVISLPGNHLENAEMSFLEGGDEVTSVLTPFTLVLLLGWGGCCPQSCRGSVSPSQALQNGTSFLPSLALTAPNHFISQD